MSIVVTTTIDISARPEQVWGVLSDFSSYGDWSNFSRIDGRPQLGRKLKMRMAGFWFTSTVTALAEGRELQWSASLVSSGLFLGEHNFTLTRLTDGTTRLINTETFSGALIRPLEGLFPKNHNDGGYAAFNRALKTRVEALSTLGSAAIRPLASASA
jgi:hypothetical protein